MFVNFSLASVSIGGGISILSDCCNVGITAADDDDVDMHDVAIIVVFCGCAISSLSLFNTQNYGIYN
jgi:hypothetical protein